MINVKSLIVKNHDIDLRAILNARMTSIVVHPHAPTHAVIEYSEERLREHKPTSVVFVDEDCIGTVSMIRGFRVGTIPGFIKESGAFEGDNDVIHNVNLVEDNGDLIYNGVLFPEAEEDLVHKAMAENSAKSRKFIVDSIGKLTISKEVCATLIAMEVDELPPVDMQPCTDLADLEPYDVVYIPHRQGVLACTLITTFQQINLKDVRNIIDPQKGDLFMVKDTGDLILIVERKGSEDLLALWNDDFYSIDDMHYVEDHISNAMLE